MVTYNYMCYNLVQHTYVYQNMYVYSIHIFYICIGRTYAPVYMSCMFVFFVLMPRYVYLYIFIGCTYAPTSQGLYPCQPRNQYSLIYTRIQMAVLKITDVLHNYSYCKYHCNPLI